MTDIASELSLYPYEAAQANNLLFLCNGHDPNYKYDGMAAAVQTFGVAAPTVAPTAVNAAGANMADGHYYIKYRYRNSERLCPT